MLKFGKNATKQWSVRGGCPGSRCGVLLFLEGRCLGSVYCNYVKVGIRPSETTLS